MSDRSGNLAHERKVRSFERAGLTKYQRRFDSRKDIRLAGKIWGRSEGENNRILTRERKTEEMKTKPVGVGFGGKDNIEPDQQYSSVEFLNKKLAQMSYTSQ